MKVLNGFAGMGGNRKLWQNVEVTAIELDQEIATLYQNRFPNDKVVVGDVKDYLVKHYKKFDFIWLSPPCQTHSSIRFMASKNGDYEAKLPDLTLYSYVIFLTNFFKGKWVVENVIPYYDPLVKPTVQLGRHYFWSNMRIPFKEFTNHEVKHNDVSGNQKRFGFKVQEFGFDNDKKRTILRNCVDPNIGLYILNCATDKVATLETFHLLACNSREMGK